MPAKALGWIIVLAVVLRLATALYLSDTVEPLPGIHDQIFYHQLAARLLEGHGFSFSTLTWPLTKAGAPTAHWSYLYTLYVAAFYAVVGPHPLAPRLVQAVAAGVLMPWLTFRLARRAWPQPAGAALVAAAWAAVYGYFAYYATALMTETFYMIGILWTLDVALRLGAETGAQHEARGLRLWLELGLAMAFTIYLRQVFMLFVPFLFLWLAAKCCLHLGRSLPARPAHALTGSPGEHRWAPLRQVMPSGPGPQCGGLIRGGLLSVAIVALLILPATLYNYQRFQRLVLLNTNAGYAFFWANHPIYGDRFVAVLLPPEMPSYQQLIPPELRQLDEAAMEGALMQRGIGFVVADPGRYLRLSLSRVPIYFQFWPSAESSGLSNLVRVTSFGLALPFMLVGIGVWAADSLQGGSAGPGGLLLLFAVVYSLIHLLSWALIRYRLPVDAVMLVFAGRGAAQLTTYFSGRN